METLNRALLLQKDKLERVEVDLGNNQSVWVRQMTGRERDQFEQSLIKEIKDKKGNVTGYDRALGDFRAKLAVSTVCDAEGSLVFLADDYSLLSQNMSAFKLEKIVNAAQKLNAISEEDKEALVKNLKADPEDNSSSVSAKN